MAGAFASEIGFSCNYATEIKDKKHGFKLHVRKFSGLTDKFRNWNETAVITIFDSADFSDDGETSEINIGNDIFFKARNELKICMIMKNSNINY